MRVTVPVPVPLLRTRRVGGSFWREIEKFEEEFDEENI
jgi:hypothetical protein